MKRFISAARIRHRLALLLILLCLASSGCGEEAGKDETDPAAGVQAQGKLIEHFKRQSPELEIIQWVEADLNHDGRLDCIVMYRVGADKNMMRAILDLESGYLHTNEVPAPHADQRIQLRDIDKKPPMEFIVQGTKGNKFGFAVFRIEENRLVDLFGEGMEDCC